MSLYPVDAPSLAAVLRPALEPARYVSDVLVHALLLADPLGYRDFRQSALRRIAADERVPNLPPKGRCSRMVPTGEVSARCLARCRAETG